MVSSDIPVRLLNQLVGHSRFDLYELSGKDTPLDIPKGLPFAVAKVLREVRAHGKSGDATDRERAHVEARVLRARVDELIVVLETKEGRASP
jgi:hypothetical protein